jgi:hypothetical protein
MPARYRDGRVGKLPGSRAASVTAKLRRHSEPCAMALAAPLVSRKRQS